MSRRLSLLALLYALLVAMPALHDPNFERSAYDPWVAYGRSKTANALFAVGMTARYQGDGITTNITPAGPNVAVASIDDDASSKDIVQAQVTAETGDILTMLGISVDVSGATQFNDGAATKQQFLDAVVPAPLPGGTLVKAKGTFGAQPKHAEILQVVLVRDGLGDVFRDVFVRYRVHGEVKLLQLRRRLLAAHGQVGRFTAIETHQVGDEADLRGCPVAVRSVRCRHRRGQYAAAASVSARHRRVS